MFEDALLEFGRSGEAHRRGATTVFAFVLQCLAVGIVSLISLSYTHVIPKPQSVVPLVAPPPSVRAPALGTPTSKNETDVQPEAVHKPVHTQIRNVLQTPTKVPTKTLTEESETPPPPPVMANGIPGGVPGGQLGGILGGGIAGSAAPQAPIPKPAPAKRVRVSEGIVGGSLLHKVTPSYPQSARQGHISGSVVLQAVIGKDGGVQNLQVVQGDPVLASAAIDAVKQWRYKPYLLNGQPVEVETIITVNFNLGKNS